jgi:hypothetical protein
MIWFQYCKRFQPFVMAEAEAAFRNQTLLVSRQGVQFNFSIVPIAFLSARWSASGSEWYLLSAA